MTATTERAQAPAMDAPDFETVFLEHWPRVHRVLTRLLGDPDEAQDVALETFWRLNQRPHEWRRAGFNLGGWLQRVATRLGLNALRAARRRAAYETRFGWETQAPDDPAQAAIAADESRRVRRALAQMSARSAQALMLRAAGLAYREIAAEIGVAPGSVGTLLARAEREFEQLF